MTRAAIYCRVSTDKQEEGTSLDGQEAECRKYCTEHGYEVVVVEREVHSGADLHGRPGFSALREMAKAGQIEVIVTWAVDRLTRSQVHMGVVFDEADRCGVRLETVREPIENNPIGMFIMNARAFAAEIEREKTRERTMAGKLRSIKNGRLPGGSTPLFGYRNTPEKKPTARLINVEEAAIVRSIFERVLTGEGLVGIVRWLNESGIDSPAKRKGTVYKDGRIPVWSAKSVNCIIRNPAYKGWTVAYREYRKKKPGKSPKGSGYIKPEDEWMVLDETGTTTPAIIDPIRWQQANDRLASNTGAYGRNQRGQQAFLMRGRVYCGVCGEPMYAQASVTETPKSLRFPRYRCRRAYRCQRAYRLDFVPCPGKPSIRIEDLDNRVWSAVADVLRDRNRVIAEIKKRLDSPDRLSAAAEQRYLESAIYKEEQRKSRLIKLYMNEKLSEPEFDSERAEVDGSLARLVASLDEVQRRVGSMQAHLVSLDSLDDVAMQTGGDFGNVDFETKLRIVNELGVRAHVSKHLVWLSWELPLVTGSEGDLSIWIEPTFWKATAGPPTTEQIQEYEEFQAMEASTAGSCSAVELPFR